jgi:transcriptional regulator with XRE-family HTH domain
MADDQAQDLGANLRELRNKRGLSLRELERRSGINNAYLSQLERGDVAQPMPSMLGRLAEAYEVPVETLMGWAGYAVSPKALTRPQAKALNYFADASDEEVEALRAILEVLRSRGATFAAPHPTDRVLAPEETKVIRDLSVALLREAGALGTFPTPLDELMGVAKLVLAGEIILTPGEKRSLLRRFGSHLDRAMRHMHGMLSYEQNAIWLASDLHLNKKRFVHAHELGHHILPLHRQLAYLDNWETMDGDLRDACEREANQAAIEILAQGDRLREMADDSRLGVGLLERLSRQSEISLQATARRISEDSKRLRCAVISYRGGQSGKLMPPHFYPSASFERRFRWLAGRAPLAELSAALHQAAVAADSVALIVSDVGGRAVELRCETLETPYARIGLVRKPAAKPVASVFPIYG